MTWKGEKPNELYPKRCSHCSYKGFEFGSLRFCPECGWELEICDESELPEQIVREHVKRQQNEGKRKKKQWQDYLKSRREENGSTPVEVT